MKSPLPPRLAIWLLEALGGDARFEALIGDLAEQFDAGRSRRWYWRQAAGALVFEVWRRLRLHAASFAAAVGVGCAVSSVWILANSVVFRSVYDSLGTGRHPFTLATLRLLLGLRVAQASLSILTFVSAWFVTRIHRANPRAVLMAFVIALIAQRIPHIARLASEALDEARLPPLLLPQLISTALQSVFTLVPGLWMIRQERFAQMAARTRGAALCVLVLVFVSSSLFDAWQVGAISYAWPARYTVDAAEILSCAYLALLMWRRNPTLPDLNRGTV